MDKRMIAAVCSLIGMPPFKVKDDSTNVPGARFAVFHSSPKLPTKRKIQPVVESVADKKKRYASLRRQFK